MMGHHRKLPNRPVVLAPPLARTDGSDAVWRGAVGLPVIGSSWSIGHLTSLRRIKRYPVVHVWLGPPRTHLPIPH